jgi:hypothetical protein
MRSHGNYVLGEQLLNFNETGCRIDERIVSGKKIAPLPTEEVRVTGLEITSLILGIIGISIHWMVFFKWGFMIFIIPFILSILALVCGFISARSLLRIDNSHQNGEGNMGLAGLALGLLTLMLTISWLILAQTYLWGWEL